MNTVFELIAIFLVGLAVGVAVTAWTVVRATRKRVNW
jgi:hypothetical protein